MSEYQSGYLEAKRLFRDLTEHSAINITMFPVVLEEKVSGYPLMARVGLASHSFISESEFETKDGLFKAYKRVLLNLLKELELQALDVKLRINRCQN